MKAVWKYFDHESEEPLHQGQRNSARTRRIPAQFHRAPRNIPEDSFRNENSASGGSRGQHSYQPNSAQHAHNNRPRTHGNRQRHFEQNYGAGHGKHEKDLSRSGHVQHGIDYPLSSRDSKTRSKENNGINFEAARNSNAEMRKERKIIFGYKKMKELLEKDSNEILFTLIMPNNGFSEMLDTVSEKRDLIALTLIAIADACTSSHRTNVSSLLTTVTQNKNFMVIALTQYFAVFGCSKNESYHYESLFKAMEFFDCYQKLFTASSCEVLLTVLPLFKIACTAAFANDPQKLNDLERRIWEIEKVQNEFLQSHTLQEIKKSSKMQMMNSQQPPEDFRSIPILPNEKDIFEMAPFLRPNIVDGKYSDAEHYLDVQFRLLREDYVRPLREGIAIYRRLKKLGQPVGKNKEVKIYQNVRIIKQDFFNSEIIHIAMFDVKEYSRVNWEHSKRFLTGSLLCLSSDDFNTMHFANVMYRDVDKLKEGFLILRFEDISYASFKISPLEIFVMVETSAYFEAYRHNLSALHAMSVNSFPLKKYIVDVVKNVQNPAYLKPDTTYDMVPILDKTNSNNLSNLLAFEHGSIEQRAKHINVLNDFQWLTHTELGLDPSQYKSLKAAVTKEFAIIQGPPGTGKTFVGLKIVQLLLHNSLEWNSHNEVSPILIVCYTNHALDQFLEGIHNFTDSIVRVGGRCSSEELAQYQLKNLRKSVREKRTVPSHIFSNVRHQHLILDQLRKEISRTRKEIDNSFNSLLSEEILRPCIDKTHYDSLKLYMSKELDDGMIVMDWLNLRYREFEEENTTYDDYNPPESNFSLKSNPPTTGRSGNTLVIEQHKDFINQKLASANFGNKICDEEVEEEEYDAEFIEDMRDIDNEDFSALKFEDSADNVVDSLLSSVADGWQVQGGTKKRKQFIMKQLASTVALPENVSKGIKDVWKLNENTRWQLYKYWLQRFIEVKMQESLDLQSQIQKECGKLTEMRTEEDLFLLHNARVIGMTTTGAAKYRNIVLNVKPKIVVVEEAAEVLEAHIVTSLVEETQHLILIGDHQQLRPSPNVYDLAIKFNLNISLFERMVNNGMPFCQLQLQHRMRPSIAELLVPHIYPNLKNHSSVLGYENIKGILHNVYFVSHNFVEGNEFDSKSRVNEHEASFVVQLCKYLLLQGYDASKITILTTYTGQLGAIKRLARTSILKGVRITVVDNYQGEENDILIISFVRSNDEGNIGFLKVSNRVCVSLSRARKGLFCIGNFSLLAQNSEVWKNILETLKKRNTVGPTLSLQCQNHENIITEVSKSEDFNKVAEGGCMQLCNYRLDCGHTCTKICHSYDRQHKNVKCRKPCSKILCEKGHKCSNPCYMECGLCMVLVLKVLPHCFHEVRVPCSVSPQDFQCKEPCMKLLPCGHQCRNYCGQPCENQRCSVKVSQTLLCGHNFMVPCAEKHHIDEFLPQCTSPCQNLLQCGHKCSGSCGKCHQGRLHQKCNKNCNRILVCGHKCSSPCSNICPPCKKPCENYCVHSQCKKMCGEPCEMCSEPCSWSCKHKKCSNPCGEMCDIEPCNYPCEKLLPCKHRCVGFCGEPCPTLCAECDPQKLFQIYFGMEDEEDAKFVLLEDCGHIFEVQGLTHWMMRESRGKIEMKVCPNCKCIIRNNMRFNNMIKYSLSYVEKVKQIIYGNAVENKSKKVLLLKELNQLKHYSYFKKLLEPIQKHMERRENLSSMLLIKCENIIKIAAVFLKIKEQSKEKIIKSKLLHSLSLRLTKFLSETENLISQLILDSYFTASEQECLDVERELARLQLIYKFLECTADSAIEIGEEAASLIAKSIINLLCKLGPFNQADEMEILRHLKTLCASKMPQFFEREKLSLISMDRSQGNWYYCSRKHIYCLKECNEGFTRAACPKCIGSTHNVLKSTFSIS